MGTVYAAEHAMLGRPAAIKVLRPERARSQESVERFLLEAKAASNINHPGIVKVYDIGEREDGKAFLVMEHLEGESLEARLHRSGPLDSRQSMRFAVQIASALQAAHASGIVHRDLKPGNLFIVRDAEVSGGERIKILDFGIAKVATAGDTRSSKTRGDMLLGSPVYMAPEQCRRADDVDHRADLYSLGCIFFEMLCGRPPFAHDNAATVIAAHLREEPPAPSSLVSPISPELDRVIARLLAKDPAMRFQDVAELVQAMAQSAGGTFFGSILITRLTGVSRFLTTLVVRPSRNRPIALVLTVTVLALIGALLVLWPRGKQAAPGPELAAEEAPGVPSPSVAELPPRPVPSVRVRMLRDSSSAEEPVNPVIAILGFEIRPVDEGDWQQLGDIDFSFNGILTGRSLRELISLLDVLTTRATSAPAVTWSIATSPLGAQVLFADGAPVDAQNITPLVIDYFESVAREEILIVRLDGYEEESVAARFDRNLSTRIELVPIPEITIRTEPAGAAIHDTGGDQLGITPWTTALSRKDKPRQLILRMDDYEEQTMTLGPEEAISGPIELIPIPRIRLVTSPRKVEVLDPAGTTLGLTPITIPLPRKQGPLTITLRRQGYEEQRVVLRPEGPPPPRIELVPRIAIHIESSPSSTPVYDEEGTRIGETPFMLELPRSTRARVFELARDGYQRASVRIVPTRSRTARLSLERIPQLITLEIASDPPGADVLVKDRLVGTTPYKVTQLEAPGRTDYVLKHKNYRDKVIEVRTDQSRQITASLEPCNPKKDRRVLSLTLADPYRCDD